MCRISVALMIDRANDGVAATRQGCDGDEHQREFTHAAGVPKVIVIESANRSSHRRPSTIVPIVATGPL